MTRRTGSALILIAVIIIEAVLIVAPIYVEGSEFRIKPGISLSEEYNDNIFLVPENRSYDYISQIAPSINLLYKVPLWDWDVSYLYDYRYYARYDINQNNAYTLNIENHTRIIDEYVYLDIRDKYERVSLDLARDYTQESTFVNQTDRNILTVNPYFIIRPTSQMTVTTGYIYSNTWYKDPAAIDQTDNIVYTGLQQDLSRRSNMTVGIRHDQNTNILQDFTKDDIYLGQIYEYVENSTLSVTLGNTWFNDKKNTERITQLFWDANLKHRYSNITVTYETGLRFIPDPYEILKREDRYLATVKREVERTSFAVSGGVIEYRTVKDKRLENSTYRVSGTMGHAMSGTSKIILELEMDRSMDYPAYTKTDRYLTRARFEHRTAETLTWALDYRYSNVYSSNVYSDNYYNNRFTIELQKVF